jgi:hypothetical protein
MELEEEEQWAGGASGEEARYAALRTFGNPALLREQTHATWSWNRLESLLWDLRFSLRTLRRTPGFTVIAIAVMALGIWRQRRAVHGGTRGFAQALAVP